MDRRRFIAMVGATSVGSAMGASNFRPPYSPSSRKVRAIAFDAFVIFDPRPIAKRVEEVFPGRGPQLTVQWRSRQFEYTWLRTSGAQYKDFWHVTDDALTQVTESMGVELDSNEREYLMSAYLELPIWPEVPAVLEKVRHRRIRMAFLSNFTAEMMRTNLRRAGLSEYFEDLLTTDRVKSFKPSPRAYQMGLDHFGLARNEVLFAAFAGWDAVGAKWFGYPTAWVNRAKMPPERLDLTPDFTLADMDELSEVIPFK
ncbi:MAG: haloacid dehalogenase type II [Terriglobia bacterium]|nr:haloacid dehalogenase type II [Terriglobia bacterium]